MTDDLPLAERGRLLSELAATLATLPPEQPQPWRLGEAMRQMLRADGVAITVEYLSDSRTTICASDDVAVALESLQEVTGEGPGFDAARTQRIVTARLEQARDRWPMLAPAVEQRLGPVLVYAIPLEPDRVPRGVATVYTRNHAPLARAPQHMFFLANAVSVALVVDMSREPSGSELTGSWDARSVVHQATGMVMAQLLVTAEDALALLRGHAYAHDTDINDVASGVVRRAINFTSFDVEEN